MFFIVTRDSEMDSYSGVDIDSNEEVFFESTCGGDDSYRFVIDSDGNNCIESVGGDGLTLGNWSDD